MPFSNHSPPMSRHLPHCLVGTLAITPQGHDAAGQQPPMVVSFPSTVLTGYIVTGLIVSGYSVFGRLGLAGAQSCAEATSVTRNRGLWRPRSCHPGGEGAQPGELGRTSRTALDLHRASRAWATQPQPPQHPEDRQRPRRGCRGVGAGVAGGGVVHGSPKRAVMRTASRPSDPRGRRVGNRSLGLFKLHQRFLRI